MSETTTPLSMAARLRQSAAVLGDAIAARSIRGIDDFSEISWRELDRKSDRVAAALLRMDVEARRATVLLLTRNAVDHAVYAYGAWKAGQTVLCLPPGLGATEGQAILSRLGRTISAGAEVEWDKGERLRLTEDSGTPGAELNDRVANPMLLVATGGSTGIPKLVDVLGIGQFVPGAFLGGLNTALKRRARAKAFIMTPLSHGAGSATAYMAMFEECEVTSLEKFDAEVSLWAIERFALEQLTIVPTMMHRMLKSANFASERLRSIRSIVHTGGHADSKDKEAWMNAIGPEKVVEVWGSSESVGHAVIDGNEWLAHRGSVGKPVNCRMRIVDAGGKDLPVGEIGEIFVQPLIPKVDLDRKYYGSTQRMRSLDGYVSFGDLGYVDADGYLYIAGRTDDLIITGGANVYPDEVEIPVRRLPGVADCVVVGRPHPELHQSVHAVICMEPGAAPMTVDELRTRLNGELSAYKLPRSVEYRSEMPRTDAGKIRRSSYRAAAKSE
jgi:bile acid-coenzyme A ligase